MNINYRNAVLSAVLIVLSNSASAFTRVISVGSNQSYDTSLETLQFAEEDARKFSLAMKTVGMVPNLKISTLINPTIQSFRDTLSLLAREKQKNGRDNSGKSKLIFYFSGHSDENGLHFVDGLLPKAELHRFLSKSQHGTKIAILDSCFSGALVAKGVRKSGSFDIPILNVDEPTGSIYLTSSSSSQFAYESDALKGSVFSHHLIAGMYGDGDLNKDGIVTIDELYQYVYKNTKWHALTLPHKKTQDPEISSKLHGQGAVVLSYPVELDAVIGLPDDLSGIVSIVSDTGYQIFSIQKIRGEARQVKMPPGKYSYSIVDGNRSAQGAMVLVSHQTTLLNGQNISWHENKDRGREKGVAAVAEVSPASPQPSSDGSIQNILLRRYAAGFHSDIDSSELGPNVGGSIGKRHWLRSNKWLGWGYDVRFGAFRVETGGDRNYSKVTNTAASLLGIVSGSIGFLEVGYGLGQMGVFQELSSHGESVAQKRVAFPLSTMLFGMHFPLKSGRTIGIEYAKETLDISEVSNESAVNDSVSVQVLYGL